MGLRRSGDPRPTHPSYTPPPFVHTLAWTKGLNPPQTTLSVPRLPSEQPAPAMVAAAAAVVAAADMAAAAAMAPAGAMAARARGCATRVLPKLLLAATAAAIAAAGAIAAAATIAAAGCSDGKLGPDLSKCHFWAVSKGASEVCTGRLGLSDLCILDGPACPSCKSASLF